MLRVFESRNNATGGRGPQLRGVTLLVEGLRQLNGVVGGGSRNTFETLAVTRDDVDPVAPDRLRSPELRRQDRSRNEAATNDGND